VRLVVRVELQHRGVAFLLAPEGAFVGARVLVDDALVGREGRWQGAGRKGRREEGFGWDIVEEGEGKEE
jgi:hypothetical protein